MLLLTERFSHEQVFLISSMPARFTTVDSLDKLDALIAESHVHPVFLFKHSNSCGISAHIKFQLSPLDAEVHIIVVQESRPVSNSVVERLGVRHASPQAFVLSGGKVIYHATHYGIDPAAIQESLMIAKATTI
jgi:thioredoxin 1